MGLFVENTRTIKAYGRIKNNEKASKLKILKFQNKKNAGPTTARRFIIICPLYY